MTIKVDKKLVDDVIKNVRNYFEKNGAKKHLHPMFEAEEKLETVLNYYQVNLVADLAKYSITDHVTYDQIYKSLAVMGIEVIKITK